MRCDRIEYFDDIDGKLLDDKTMMRVPVGWLGVDYELQTSPANFKKLEKQMGKLVETAPKVGGRKRQPLSGAPTNGGNGTARAAYTMKDVRDWAAKHDIEVNAKGRIPNEIIEAFEAEQ